MFLTGWAQMVDAANGLAVRILQQHNVIPVIWRLCSVLTTCFPFPHIPPFPFSKGPRERCMRFKASLRMALLHWLKLLKGRRQRPLKRMRPLCCREMLDKPGSLLMMICQKRRDYNRLFVLLQVSILWMNLRQLQRSIPPQSVAFLMMILRHQKTGDQELMLMHALSTPLISLPWAMRMALSKSTKRSKSDDEEYKPGPVPPEDCTAEYGALPKSPFSSPPTKKRGFHLLQRKKKQSRKVWQSMARFSSAVHVYVYLWISEAICDYLARIRTWAFRMQQCLDKQRTVALTKNSCPDNKSKSYSLMTARKGAEQQAKVVMVGVW